MMTTSIETGPTTNEDDQQKAAELIERLRTTKSSSVKDDSKTITATTVSSKDRLPEVDIAEGCHKYVLISATWTPTNEVQYIVTSRKGISYHQDAATPMVHKLEMAGNGHAYTNIDITGGGRISCNSSAKTIEIYGFSYSFGRAQHGISKMIIEKDSRYKDYVVTWNNDGY